MDALLRDTRVFKSKVTRLEKQIAAWQDGTDRNTELLSIYLIHRNLRLNVIHYSEAFVSNVKRNITRYKNRSLKI
jgi:hypothetical protein